MDSWNKRRIAVIAGRVAVIVALLAPIIIGAAAGVALAFAITTLIFIFADTRTVVGDSRTVIGNPVRLVAGIVVFWYIISAVTIVRQDLDLGEFHVWGALIAGPLIGFYYEQDNFFRFYFAASSSVFAIYLLFALMPQESLELLQQQQGWLVLGLLAVGIALWFWLKFLKFLMWLGRDIHNYWLKS